MLYPTRVFRASITHFAIAVVAVLTLLGAWPSEAQTDTATLYDVLFDTSGAVIPQALITLENTATGTVRSGNTKSSGEFTLPALSPAWYSLRVEKEGFSTL